MAEDNAKYQVIISTKAMEMLVSHAAFLAEVSESAADRLVNAFEKAAKSLEHMPHRNPWFSGEYMPSLVYRKLLFEERYLMLYQVKGHQVFVDYVVDCRQGYGWLLT